MLGSNGSEATLQADWYGDPSGAFEHRYWDGTQWTSHVASRGVSATSAVAAEWPDPSASPPPPPPSPRSSSGGVGPRLDTQSRPQIGLGVVLLVVLFVGFLLLLMTTTG